MAKTDGAELSRPVATSLVKLDTLTPYARNSRTHTDAQVAQIAASIDEFGLVGGIVVRDGTIAKGHGTLLAVRKLYGGGGRIYPPPGRKAGAKPYPDGTVPVLRADGWSEAQFRAYVIADNQLALGAGWDEELLKGELTDLRADGFDLTVTGFSDEDLREMEEAASKEYTRKIEAPTYKVTGPKPDIRELMSRETTTRFEAAIRAANIPEDEKEFLLAAAQRHTVFNFEKVAEYYAQSSPAVQELMEQQALVIIDVGRAIENGYTAFSERISEFIKKDHPDGKAEAPAAAAAETAPAPEEAP